MFRFAEMCFQILTVSSFLALVTAAPAPATISTPPTFIQNPNKSAGVVPRENAPVNLKVSAATTRYGIGSVVTGPGLDWYSSDLTVGGSGYSDPSYYNCFRGVKENFPEFSRWMNFETMFGLNKKTSMEGFNSGAEQGTSPP
jgi:hypothetical protein